REGFVDRRIVTTLGSGMVVGSLVGAIGSRWGHGNVLQGVFAAMAAAAAVLMGFGRPRLDAGGPVGPWGAPLGFILGLAGGVLAGMVGAGGAFLLLPLMLYVLHVPARSAVGSSLGVVAIGATAGAIGKLITGQIPGWPALALVAGALPAAQLGAATSKRLHA